MQQHIVDVTQREFLGKVLPDLDPKHQGRYKVFIPNLMPHIANDKGIWVKNHIHKNRITPSKDGNYGQYFPLHANTLVIVKFFENDYNSGYIDRIVSDFEIESLPLKVIDRDDLTQLFRTPKKNNIFVVNEETTDQPPNSIHLYFNEYRTIFIIDEEGIHISTLDNEDKEILKDNNQYVHGNKKVTIDLDNEVLIKGNKKQTINGDYEIVVEGNLILTVKGQISMQSEVQIVSDAPVIHENSGLSIPAMPTTGAVIPVRKAEYSERSEKSNVVVTRMIVKDPSSEKYADYNFFKKEI